MRRGAFFGVVLGVLLSGCVAPPAQNASSAEKSGRVPEVSDNLTAVIGDVQTSFVAVGRGDLSKASNLQSDILILSRAIDGGRVQEEGQLVLKFYRGMAQQSLASTNAMIGLPVDTRMAKAALADYSAIINTSLKSSRVTALKSQALYMSGGITLNDLNAPPQAMHFYRKCAALENAACQNVMASVMVSGYAGVKKDVRAAAKLYQSAVESGVSSGCAGAFSALSLASIQHFTGISVEGNDDLHWLRKAYRLGEQMKARSEGHDVCGTANYYFVEYLMRLDKGDPQPALLQHALDEHSPPVPDPIAKLAAYLKGDLSANDYREVVLGIEEPYSRCDYAFKGFWKAATAKHNRDARAFRSILEQDRDNLVCLNDLEFARHRKL